MPNKSEVREILNREQIVRHTLGLLDDRGLAGFRLKDLASRLDVTIPNLYRHFKNRDDIVFTALAEDYISMCGQVATGVREAATTISSLDDLLRLLQETFSQQHSTIAQRRRTIRLQVLAASGHNEQSHDIEAALHSVHVALESLFDRAHELNLIDRRFSSRSLMLVTSSLLTGIAVTEVDPTVAPAEPEMWAFFAVALAALAPSGASDR